MTARRAFHGFVQTARAFGWRPALVGVEYRAVNRVARLTILHGLAAAADAVERAPADLRGCTVRLVQPDEARAAATTPAWTVEMSSPFVERALARGHECVGVFDGNALVSVGWYARRPAPINESLMVSFDPAWTYMYKAFTQPSHRGRRLHGAAMTWALGHYAGVGGRGLVAYVEYNNWSSLRSFANLGFKRFHDLYLIGRTHHWSTPGGRHYGVRLERV